MISSRYKLIFFDNDGTLNDYRSTWEYLHRYFGTWEPHASALDKKLMRERYPYDQYASESAALFRGTPKYRFLERMRNIDFRPGAVELVKILQNNGLSLAVISSGISLWRDMWQERSGIIWKYYQANDLIFDDNDICTGTINIQVTDNVPGMDKGTWVEKISEIEKIPYENRVFIGDGWGDVPGFRKCGLSIAIDPNMKEVIEAADHVLDGTDLMQVMNYL